MRACLVAAFTFLCSAYSVVVGASNTAGPAEKGALSTARPEFQTFLEQGEFRRTDDGRCVLEIRELDGLQEFKSDDTELSIPVIRVHGVRVTCNKPYRPLPSVTSSAV